MVKRCFDLFVAATGLIVLAPVLLVAGLLVRWQDRGPALFRQERVGRHGRTFTIFKFRSMAVAAPHLGAGITRTGDPRVTSLGRFLRRSKMDELPQLWNVLVGDMSLVGPRPELPQFVRQYTSEQRTILNLRPGITDLASLLYRREEELLRNAPNVEQTYLREIMPHKLQLSLVYARHATFQDDLKILLRTLLPWMRLSTRAERAIARDGLEVVFNQAVAH